MDFAAGPPTGIGSNVQGLGNALDSEEDRARRRENGPGSSRDRAWLAALVRSARRGDKEAYGQLVERYRTVVVASIYAQVRRRETAEDLAQECFIKAYSALENLREPTRFAGWLRTIAANTASDWLRARRSEVNLDRLTEAGAEPTAPQLPPGQALVDGEEEDAVLEALAALRSDYREIVVLKHVENRSYREIAEMLGMSVTAVGEKLSRVRALLRRKLKGYSDVPPSGRGGRNRMT